MCDPSSDKTATPVEYIYRTALRSKHEIATVSSTDVSFIDITDGVFIRAPRGQVDGLIGGASVHGVSCEVEPSNEDTFRMKVAWMTHLQVHEGGWLQTFDHIGVSCCLSALLQRGRVPRLGR